MARLERFSFLCNSDERHLIAILAKWLQRSQSDAVRFVVIRAVRELQEARISDKESSLLARPEVKEKG